MEVFEQQSEEYKEKVLPKAVRARVGVEALIGFDNPLHQMVAHDVFLLKLHLADAFHAIKHAKGVNQA